MFSTFSYFENRRAIANREWHLFLASRARLLGIDPNEEIVMTKMFRKIRLIRLASMRLSLARFWCTLKINKSQLYEYALRICSMDCMLKLRVRTARKLVDRLSRD